MPPLTAPGRRRAGYPLREKVAADRAQLEASHALPLVATVHLRTAALHSGEAGGSMQLAQAAKEKMHAPVFSLAASAAALATTKSAGTNRDYLLDKVTCGWHTICRDHENEPDRRSQKVRDRGSLR